MTTTTTLNRMTNAATAFRTWAALETALRAGYVPTLRGDTGAEGWLQAALEARGYRYWDGR